MPDKSTIDKIIEILKQVGPFLPLLLLVFRRVQKAAWFVVDYAWLIVKMPLEMDRIKAGVQESEATQQILLSINETGELKTDADGNCIFINDQLVSMFKVSLSAMKGRGWLTLVSEADRDSVRTAWGHAVAEKTRLVTSFKMLENGHTIDVLFRAFPVYDEGRLTGWECFIHDQKHSIPNIVRSLSRLEMKQEQFAELLETHTYISSAAHKNIQSRLKDYEARMEKAERQQRLHNTWIEGERAKS